MRYRRVCLEAFAHTLPEEVVTSDQLETQLEPLYQRLRLPAGRLELMTGIRERRFWLRGMLPGEQSALSGELAIQRAGIDRAHIGAVVHASVCRDFVEPATACGVHHRLGLRPDCLVYDVSNACLGMLNGMMQVANMIELRQIRAGLVVGTEGSRRVVENTIRHLNANESLTRDEVKLAVASLTLGSGSAAVLLCDDELSRHGNRLLAGTARAATAHHELCQGGRQDEEELPLLMRTDSERLMHAGVELAKETFELFLAEVGWRREEIAKTFCHQVGGAHRKFMFNSLGLDTALDFATFDYLGNTGSVALPTAASLGIEQGRLQAGDRAAMLGIGSGINCLMLGVEWRSSSPDSPARG